MNTRLGILNIVPIKERPELLAEPVAKAISNLSDADTIGVTEIDPRLSDTTAFCAQYQVDMNRTVNCVVLEAKRGDRTWFATAVIFGDTRADVNGLARRTLEARKVSFAPMDQAVAQTGMEYGGISPIGIPADWPILIDKAVADSEYVIVGSGIRKSKLVIPGKILAALPNAKVLESLGQKK